MWFVHGLLPLLLVFAEAPVSLLYVRSLYTIICLSDCSSVILKSTMNSSVVRQWDGIVAINFPHRCNCKCFYRKLEPQQLSHEVALISAHELCAGSFKAWVYMAELLLQVQCAGGPVPLVHTVYCTVFVPTFNSADQHFSLCALILTV